MRQAQRTCGGRADPMAAGEFKPRVDAVLAPMTKGGEIREPFQPEPTARCAVHHEMQEGLLVAERRYVEAGGEANILCACAGVESRQEPGDGGATVMKFDKLVRAGPDRLVGHGVPGDQIDVFRRPATSIAKVHDAAGGFDEVVGKNKKVDVTGLFEGRLGVGKGGDGLPFHEAMRQVGKGPVQVPGLDYLPEGARGNLLSQVPVANRIGIGTRHPMAHRQRVEGAMGLGVDFSSGHPRRDRSRQGDEIVRDGRRRHCFRLDARQGFVLPQWRAGRYGQGMGGTGPLRRLKALTRTERLLLAEAVAALARAAFVVRFRPFRRAVGFAAHALGTDPALEPDLLRWAVEVAARRVPFRAKCFEQGLALQAMLRRRGAPAKLHYGVGYDAHDRLAAHVWVSLDGRILIGGEEAWRFRELAAYP